MNKATNYSQPFPCPNCGKKGMKWDYAAKTMRCPHCHISGVKSEGQPDPPSPPAPSEKPAPLTNKDIERNAMNANLAARVTETYTYEHPNGEHGNVTVERIIPVVPDDKVPDLTIHYPTAMFHKWRLRDLIEKEKRWGRDDLRKRGFRKFARGIDPATQKGVNILARPGEEEKEGTGRYALGHAIAVIRRAEQKLRNSDE